MDLNVSQFFGINVEVLRNSAVSNAGAGSDSDSRLPHRIARGVGKPSNSEQIYCGIREGGNSCAR